MILQLNYFFRLNSEMNNSDLDHFNSKIIDTISLFKYN